MTYKLEDAITEARKFNHKKDLFRESHWAYNKIRKAGIEVFDAACHHMEPLGNKYYRCLYSISLDKEIYIGLTGNPNQRLKGHTNKGTPDVKRILNAGAKMEILSEFIPAHDASVLEKSLIKKFKADGFRLLNKYNDGGLGSNERIWDEQTIRDTAKVCDSVKNFRALYPGAYKAAKNIGIFAEITGHMTRDKKLYSEDIVEEIYKAASTCSTLAEFREKYSAFYHHSIRTGIFKKIKSTLKTERIYWTDEALLHESLKYKTKSEFRLKSSKAHEALRLRCRINGTIFCPHMKPKVREFSDEYKAMLSDRIIKRNKAGIGISLTNAHRLNISLSLQGKKISENQKQKISEAKKIRQATLDEIDPPSIKNLKERLYRKSRRIRMKCDIIEQ